jgi:hypothetical protein
MNLPRIHDFYENVTNSKIFIQKNRKVFIYVLVNSAFEHYFIIPTNDHIWKDKYDLFVKLSDGKEGVITFYHFFMDSKTDKALKEENIIQKLER